MNNRFLNIKKLRIIVGCVILIGGIILFWQLFTDGFAHSGDTWQDTPEKALEYDAKTPIPGESPGILVPKTILNKVYIDDIVEMTFVSSDDTLVSVSFVTNDKGQYSVYGYSEEEWLDSPTMFLMNGDPKQLDFNSDEFILFPASHHNTTVYGWCYSGYNFTVNGKEPKKETYVFDCQGKTWSLDYWQIENIPEDSEICIEYIG